MSLHKVQPSYGLMTPQKVSKAGGGEGAPAAAGEGGAAETVRLSDEGRMMSKLTARVLPNQAKVRELTAVLAGDLKNLFGRSAIDTRSGVGLEVDSPSGRVNVKGNRTDAPVIAELIEGQPHIGRQIHDIVALSGHVVATEQAEGSRQARLAAQAATQVGSYVADYGSRLTGNDEPGAFSLIGHGRAAGTVSHAIEKYAAVAGSGASTGISLVFNGTDVQVRSNGKPWISASA